MDLEGLILWSLIVAACADAPDDMYTPYADVADPADRERPLPMPQLARPSFQRRRFNIVDFGAVGDGQNRTRRRSPALLPRPSRRAAVRSCPRGHVADRADPDHQR